MPHNSRARTGDTATITRALVALLMVMLRPAGARAQGLLATISQLERHELAALALIMGVISFAVVTGIALVLTRARAARALGAARAQVAELKDQVDRAQTLLFSEPQVIIAWSGMGEEPEIFGDTTLITPSPVPRRVLAFGTWLGPELAKTMEDAVAALRSRGAGFNLSVMTQ